MKNHLSLICTVLLFALVSCSDAKDEDVYGRFTKSSETIKPGDIYKLPFQISRNLGPFENYNFASNPYNVSTESSQTKVVEVVDCGTVKGISNGTSTISVKLGTTKFSMELNVDDGKQDKPQNKDSLAVVDANWKWTKSQAGVTSGYATFRLFDKQASISAAHYPSSQLALSIAYHTGNNCLTTSQAGSEAGAAVAINGSFFNTTTLVANTFYASAGTIICNKALDTRSNGIVGIKKGGHDVDITVASTSLFSSYASTYYDVIASGPVLLQKGQVHKNPHNDFNDTSHPRSIIGKDKSGNIWMIVIDGRFAGLGDGASIEECSLICKYLGLYDAINLDGGGSSSLWTPERGVINHPCDNKKWDHAGERKDPTIFVAK